MLLFLKMKFYVINNTSWVVSEAFLKWVLGFAKKNLPAAKSELKKNLGIVFVNGSNMRALNFKYRQKNKVTDVLSFEGEDSFLGDIVLCVPQIKKQARQHGLSAPEELTYLLIHGLLHLLGYEHEISERAAKKMFKIQDKLFADLQDRDILKAFNKSVKNGKKTQPRHSLQR